MFRQGRGVSALAHFLSLDLVHLVTEAAETGSVFDLELVGGQGGRMRGTFLVLPVDHGRVPSTEYSRVRGTNDPPSSRQCRPIGSCPTKWPAFGVRRRFL
jgi:hypothetical protein